MPVGPTQWNKIITSIGCLLGLLCNVPTVGCGPTFGRGPYGTRDGHEGTKITKKAGFLVLRRFLGFDVEMLLCALQGFGSSQGGCWGQGGRVFLVQNVGVGGIAHLGLVYTCNVPWQVNVSPEKVHVIQLPKVFNEVSKLCT